MKWSTEWLTVFMWCDASQSFFSRIFAQFVYFSIFHRVSTMANNKFRYMQVMLCVNPFSRSEMEWNVVRVADPSIINFDSDEEDITRRFSKHLIMTCNKSLIMTCNKCLCICDATINFIGNGWLQLFSICVWCQRCWKNIYNAWQRWYLHFCPSFVLTKRFWYLKKWFWWKKIKTYYWLITLTRKTGLCLCFTLY